MPFTAGCHCANSRRPSCLPNAISLGQRDRGQQHDDRIKRDPPVCGSNPRCRFSVQMSDSWGGVPCQSDSKFRRLQGCGCRAGPWATQAAAHKHTYSQSHLVAPFAKYAKSTPRRQRPKKTLAFSCGLSQFGFISALRGRPKRGPGSTGDRR